MKPSDIHTAWSRLLFRCLASSGITDVICCPGSRSTPLALAAAAEPALRVTPIVDERTAAFVALGQARATARPSVVIATSGTAGAHFFPAVIEANEARIPLIVMTADRPWELHHASASQTIDQRKLFSDHVRRSFDVGPPDAASLVALGRLAAQAVALSQWPAAGPVHFNAQFRKPLEPISAGDTEEWSALFDDLMRRGAPAMSIPRTECSGDAISSLAMRAARAQRCAVVVGPRAFTGPASDGRALGASLKRFSELYGIPILAESASGVRFGGLAGPNRVNAVDALLRARIFERAPPDLVIEIGGPLVSRAFEAFAAKKNASYRVLLTDRVASDPHGTADEVMLGDPVSALRGLCDAAKETRPQSPWARAVVRLGKETDALSTVMSRTWGEPAIARELVQGLEEDTTLIIGNSLPIRDVDTFGGSQDRRIDVHHQRGAAGIDGFIASAFGARLVTPASSPVVAFIGDVACLHDAGSISLLGEVATPLVLVVVDNAGGRIFAELPVAENADIASAFEKLFVMARPPFAAALAAAFGVSSSRVANIDAFRSEFRTALQAQHATVLECRVDPEMGRTQRRSFHDALADIVAKAALS